MTPRCEGRVSWQASSNSGAESCCYRIFGLEENWLLATQSRSSLSKIAPARAAPPSLYNHPFSLWIAEQGGVYNTEDTVHFTPLPYTSQTVQFFNFDRAHSEVEQVNNFRFLWIHVTEELLWSSHISTWLNKAQKKNFTSPVNLRRINSAPSF